jgi:predicted enzyme related to lactoylglutathione lyase
MVNRRATVAAASCAVVALMPACTTTERTTMPNEPKPDPITAWAAPEGAEPGRIVGIGGVFFRTDDGPTLQAWYAEHLDLPQDTDGFALLWWRDPETARIGSVTWGPFARESTYFDADQQYMINYIVDDLDAARARLQKAGARVDDEVQDYEYGRFGWFWDPSGTKVELFEPNPEFAEKAYNAAREGRGWSDVK